jgi:[ribosomal protein S5]-alanine N-acetyltransferase
MGDPPRGNEELLTARLALRRPTPDDLDVILRIHRDPRACAHNPSDMIATWAEAEERYASWDRHWQVHAFGYWVVHPREAGARRPVMGFCGLKVMLLAGREVLNLFYRLDPAAWGKGIATEAAACVVDWAVTHDRGRPIVARVRPENVASATVAERAGLDRAAHLDCEGEDGPDLIYVRNWPGDAR